MFAPTPSTSIETALEWAAQLAPPTAVIHVGVGKGLGLLAAWRDWDIPAAYLIDADPERLGWAETLAAKRPGWRVCAAVVAENDAERDFYHASNPDEDGLLPPEVLRTLWPNLRERGRERRATVPLDRLIDPEWLAKAPDCWLIIDCLPAGSLLAGAASLLERVSVLIVRRLTTPLLELETSAQADATEILLDAHGLRRVQDIEGNHPALGYTFYYRDWQASYRRTENAYQQLADELQAMQSSFHRLKILYTEEIEQAKESQERATVLASENALLMQQKMELETLLEQKQHRIEALERELAERDCRQQRFTEEMIRAEAQLDLIKDVLLREPEL